MKRAPAMPARFAALPLVAAFLVATLLAALAQAKFPSRPIRVMLPFAAGSVFQR